MTANSDEDNSMPTTSNQPLAPALWWSAEGQIACARHTPFPGSDTFRWAAWAPLTVADAKALAREIGRAPTCETCAAIELREEEAAGRG